MPIDPSDGATPLDPDEAEGLLQGHVSTRGELNELIADARLWREKEVFGIEEIAVRFHHRLVWIHPFPNGNGRHARLMADLIAQRGGHPPFSWGGGSLITTPELRWAYVSALRSADRGDLGPLMDFARS